VEVAGRWRLAPQQFSERTHHSGETVEGAVGYASGPAIMHVPRRLALACRARVIAALAPAISRTRPFYADREGCRRLCRTVRALGRGAKEESVMPKDPRDPPPSRRIGTMTPEEAKAEWDRLFKSLFTIRWPMAPDPGPNDTRLINIKSRRPARPKPVKKR